VEVQCSLEEAYSHIISLLARKSPPEDAAGADLDREVRVAALARKGGYDDPEIDYRLGMVLAEPLGAPARAKEHLERALSAKTPRALSAGRARKARAILADIYSTEGSPARAAALYESMIVQPDTDPANFEPFYELARLHAREGTPEAQARARDLYAKALAIQPEYLEAAAEIAALDYRQGALPAAEKALKAVLAKNPSDTGRAIDLAIVQVRQRRPAGAAPAGAAESAAGPSPLEKTLSDLVSRAEGSDRARAHVALGILREERGDLEGALSEYRTAMDADPASVDAKVAFALASIELSRPEDARRIAEELYPAARESPWLFAACSRILGEVESAAGKTSEALAHFQRAAEVDPDFRLLERTGILLLREGKLDLGHELLRKAREAAGDRPETLNALGYYHYSRGNFIEAGRLFEAVLKSVKAPPKAPKGAPPALVPPARAYALRGKELIEDLEKLQVLVADFSGQDGPTLNGWKEDERNGIEISRRENRAVLAGKQAGSPDGITVATFDRPVEASTWDRLRMSARPDSGKFRLGLRLEGTAARGGATAGLVFYRDLDGTLSCQVKTTQGDWESPVFQQEPPESGRPGAAPKRAWPADSGFHTLEIRRASRGAQAKAAGSGFDLLFDGELLFWNVKVAGLGGRTYTVGFSGQTDEVGNDYSFTVESFKVYRTRLEGKKRAQY
jgi:tetratricopeptide (TPR) repeat protein